MDATNSELRIEKAGDSIALVRTENGQIRSEIILSSSEVHGLARLWPEIARTMLPAAVMMAAPPQARRFSKIAEQAA